VSQNKDIERIARSMFGQKLEYDYVRYYLMEAFQLDEKAIDQVFDRIGIAKPVKGRNGQVEQPKKPTRQNFY